VTEMHTEPPQPMTRPSANSKAAFGALRNQVIKNFIGVGSIGLLATCIGLLSSVILARLLGPRGFGQYTFIMALVPLLAIPIIAGIPPLLIREVAKYSHARQFGLLQGVIRRANQWVVIFSIVVVVTVVMVDRVLYLLPKDDKWRYLITGVFILPFLGLSAVRNGSIKGLGFPSHAEFPIQVFQPTIFLIMIGFLAMAGILSIEWALLGRVIGAIAGFGFILYMFNITEPKGAKSVGVNYETKKWIAPVTA